MPGFFVSNRRFNFELTNPVLGRTRRGSLQLENHTVKYDILLSFSDDKAIFQNEGYLVMEDGYILNKHSLLHKYNEKTVSELIIHMYQENGDIFMRELRGSFRGGVYDKKRKRWIFYTNQVGDKPLFYTKDVSDFFAVGSQLSYVSDALKESNIGRKVDENAAIQLLTYGFMIENRTIIENVKRLCAGSFLLIENGKNPIEIEYHRFKKDITGITEKEAISMIDTEFTKAVKLEYEKDIEYQKKHLVDLSGGLDSRMNYWIADHLGYRNMQCITYSKSGYLDQTIAMQMASDLHHDLLFKPLDDFNFIMDIDQIVQMNNGASVYAGITGGKRLLESIFVDDYGLEHTGQLGDVIIGSYIYEPDCSSTHSNSGKYSQRLNYSASDEIINSYGSYELFLLYTRGFLGVLNTHPIRNHYIDVVSPFLNVDFIQMMLNMPEKYRFNHYIYVKWILNCWPEAAKYPWETIKTTIDTSKWRIILKRKKNGILRRMQMLNSIIRGKKYFDCEGMNPLDYWYSTAYEHKKILEDYYNENVNLIRMNISDELFGNIEKLYREGIVIEKTMALTLISGIKQFVI